MHVTSNGGNSTYVTNVRIGCVFGRLSFGFIGTLTALANSLGRGASAVLTDLSFTKDVSNPSLRALAGITGWGALLPDTGGPPSMVYMQLSTTSGKLRTLPLYKVIVSKCQLCYPSINHIPIGGYSCDYPVISKLHMDLGTGDLFDLITCLTTEDEEWEKACLTRNLQMSEKTISTLTKTLCLQTS